MGNEKRISVVLDIGAQITQYKAAMSQIQTELSKLHIPDELATDLKTIFKNYADEIKNLEQLIEREGGELTPMNEKVVKDNISKIEKLYNGLIKKLNSKGFQTSILEQDYQALKQMQNAQSQYEKTLKDTNKQIKEQENNINRSKNALEKQKRINEQNKAIENARRQQAAEFRKSTAQEVIDLKKQQEVLKDTHKEEEAQAKYRKEHQGNLRGWTQSKARTQAIEEDRQAQEKLAQVETRLQEIDKEQIRLDNEVAEAAKEAEKSQDSFAKKQIETAASISLAEDKLAELRKELDTLSKDTLKDIQQQLTESGIDWSEYGVDPTTLNSYNDLQNALTKVVEAGGNRAVEAMNMIATASSTAGTSVKGMADQVDALGYSLDNLSERQKEIDRMSQSIVRFFSIGNAVQLFKRAVRSAVNTIKDLDKVMTETAVVTDFTVADMWKQLPEYTARANKLGVTIHDVYESATLYYQQGLKTNEVMAVSNATLKMARIASLDAAEATDRMTNALRGFNMEITETNAERVADVYSKLAAVSASNVDEISTAMTKVASLASNANMRFETTAAFLSQIIETTRESAETAGTALKTVVARFSEVKSLFSQGELLGTDEEGEAIDVNKVSKALRTAGIDLNEYLTGVKGLDDIFMELASKWDSLDRVQQRYIATMAAGSRQQSRFIAMMQDYKRTTELVTYANNAMGASNEQYEKTLDSLESKLNKLKNSWNTFLMDTTNSGAVKVVVDALTGLMNVINAISSILPGFTSSILKMWAAFNIGKGIKSIFGKNGKGISAFMNFITEKDNKQLLAFPTILGKIAGNVGNLGTKIAKGEISIKGLTAKLLTSEGPIAKFKKGIEAVGSTMSATLTSIIGFAAAIGAIVLVFKALEAISPAHQLAEIKKELSDATDIANKANESYDNLRDSFKSLEEQTLTLNSLKKGTDEWNDSLLKVNQQVLDLIEKYPQLVNEVRYDKDGLYFTNTDEILKQYRTASAISNLGVLDTQMRLQQTQAKEQRSNLGLKLRWNGGKFLDQYARDYASGAKSASEVMEYFNGMATEISTDNLKELRNYGNKLNEVANTTRILNQTFIDTIKTLNEWSPEEEEAANLLTNTDFDSIINFEMATSGDFNITPGDLYKWLQEKDPNAVSSGIGNFTKYKFIENGVAMEYNYTQALERYRREKHNERKQEKIEGLVPKIAQLSPELQKLLFNPTSLKSGYDFDESRITNIINSIDGLAPLLEELNINIQDQITAYTNSTPQTRDVDTTNKIMTNTQLGSDFLNEISAEAFQVLAKNAEEYGDIINELFKLEPDPQLFSDLITRLFSEDYDLEDLDSIDKIKTQFLTLDQSLSEGKVNSFLNKLIDFTKAASHSATDILKTNITSESEILNAANEGTALDEKQYGFMKQIGVPETDFIMTSAGWIYTGNPDDLLQKIQKYNATTFAKAVTSWNNAPSDETREQLEQSAQVSGANGEIVDTSYMNAYTQDEQMGWNMDEQVWKDQQEILLENIKGLKEYSKTNKEVYDAVLKYEKAVKSGNIFEAEEAKLIYETLNAAAKKREKFKKLIDTLQDYSDILKTGNKNDTAYIDSLSTIAEVASEVFGTEITSEFVDAHHEAFAKLVDGDEDALNDIRRAIVNDLLVPMGMSGTVAAEVGSIIDSIPDMELNGTADFTDIFNQLSNLVGSAADARKILEGLGYTVEYKTWIDPETGDEHVKVELSKLKDSYSDYLSSLRSGGGRSGGGGSKEKPKYWDNPYDELYNLLEDQNEALRIREKLEREYDQILKRRTSTAQELKQNSLDEIANLQRELDIQRQIQAGRRRMISELSQQTYRDEEGKERTFANWGVTKYGWYDEQNGVMRIDWNAIDKVNDPELGGAIEAYISKLEELSQSFEETQTTIESMEDMIREIKERNMQEYLEFEERVYQAIIDREQKVIDEYSALSDTISESNSNILSSLRESIDLERQIRDNTKTEEDIADKEARLAYLQRDTSGANQTEILKLQQELDDARQSYGDTLVDQAIDQLERDNEIAEQQRQEQIEIMQAQLEYAKTTGEFWPETYNLIATSFNANGTMNENSALANLLMNSDAFAGMSKFGQMNWIKELVEEWLKAQEGLTNWRNENAQDIYTSAENAMSAYDINSGAQKSIWFDGKNWVDDKGNVYNNVQWDEQGQRYTYGSAQAAPATPAQTETPVSAPTQTSTQAQQYDTYTVKSGDNLSKIASKYGTTWQKIYDANKDIISNPNLIYPGWVLKIPKYAKGGLVDATGLAWLDGTKTSPEMVLSARDTENFIALRNALSQMLAQGGGKGGDNYFNIEINVDELANDYDVDQLADRIKKQIYDDSSYRNVNAISYLR